MECSSGEAAEPDDAGDVVGQRGRDLGRGRVHPRGDVTGKAHRLERGVEDGGHGAGAAADREQGAARRRGPHRQSLGAQGCADLLHLGRAGPVGGGVLGRGEVVVVRGRAGRRDRRDLLAQPARDPDRPGPRRGGGPGARHRAQAGRVRPGASATRPARTTRDTAFGAAPAGPAPTTNSGPSDPDDATARTAARATARPTRDRGLRTAARHRRRRSPVIPSHSSAFLPSAPCDEGS